MKTHREPLRSGRKTSLPPPCWTALGCALASVSALWAQPAAAPRAPTPPPVTAPGEDVTQLTPFVVHTSANDIGYYAENTLAGSRLNTNLGDLGASITVVTRQQMLDTASIDLNDVFLYEANTEGTGNYTAFSFNDQNTVDDATSRDPATANRVRGIGGADRARNYYQSIAGLPFDVYNTETVEINRGPNSLLFGIGSAAGIVNQSSTPAEVRRRSAEVALRYGSHDSYRASLRIHQPLVPGKLGVFVAALYDSRGFTRRPSYDISRRAYGAITFAPAPGTTVRANVERFTGGARRPNMVTPQDGITDWIAAGRPVWDPLTFTVTANGVSTRLANITAVGNVAGLGTDPLAPRPGMYYDRGGPGLWMQSALSTTGVQGPFPVTSPQLARSETLEFKQRGGTLPLYRTPGLTDRSLYDWGSVNLASSERSARTANVYNVEIDQRLAENLFAQLGWYREDYQTYQAFANGWQMVRIDPNRTLLDGTANPWFGQPYLGAVSLPTNLDDYTNQTARLSLTYELNFRKQPGWLRWLGRHRLAAIGSRHDLEQLGTRLLMVTMDNHVWVNPSRRVQGGAALQTGSVINPRVYLGQASTPGVISHDPGDVARGPLDLALRHALPIAGGAFNWINEPAHLDLTPNLNSSRTRKTTDSLTLGWQSYLWNDRIVGTAGFRRDRNRSRATNPLPVNASTGLADLAALNTYGIDDTLFGNTRTAGVVVKPIPDVSVYYNQSRNFTPAAAQFDLYGDVLALPTGRGKDYGMRFTLLQNRLVLGVNAFEASAEKARGTPATTFVQRTARVEQTFILWAEALARTRLGTGASNAAIAAEVARVTQLPEGFVSPDQNSISSTSTVEARGLELQVIFNPRRNWNLKATAGRQRTNYTHLAPELDAYTAERLPVWQAARGATGALFWTSTVPDANGGNMVPTTFWLANVASPVALAKANEGKRTQGQRAWQASAISTYRITEGRWKGIEAGGGVRWMDRAVIGYLGGPPDADGIVRTLDATRPVYDDPRPALDFWASKSFVLPPVLGRNVRVKVQGNVRNVLENGNRLEPIAVNPDGRPNTFRITDPREWLITATFQF